MKSLPRLASGTFFQNTIYQIFKDIFTNHKISNYDGSIQGFFKIKSNNFFRKNYEIEILFDLNIFALIIIVFLLF